MVSDCHAANWKQFNDNGERLKIFEEGMNQAIQSSLKYNCPILNCGDIIDHPKYIENKVIDMLSRVTLSLKKAKKIIIGINGNHDFCEKSSFEKPALGYMHHLDRLTSGSNQYYCIDYACYDTPHFRVHGIPYINNNIDFDKALKNAKKFLSKKLPNILLIHTDLPGAIEPDGKVVGSCENISKYKIFKDFDIVLSGHIHKHQKLYKNVYMVGAMMQQRRSDAGTKMGYCLLYDDFSLKFIDSKLPEFKFYDFGTDKPDTKDFWTELPPPIIEEEKGGDGKGFNVKANRKELARNYLTAKGIKSKSKFKLLTKYINV